MRLRPIVKRLAILGVSTAASLTIAEVFVRTWLPGRYQLPALMTDDGRLAPMAEAWHYLYHYGEADREDRKGPRGRLPSNSRQRLHYDRAQWDYFDADDAILGGSNELGFHDLDFAVDKPAGEFRVLALGDSFTYGLGVRLEESWPQRLERALTTELGRVEVINAGWPNTAPPDYLEWFRSDGVHFGADLVLVGLCLNDMAPVPILACAQADPKPELG